MKNSLSNLTDLIQLYPCFKREPVTRYIYISQKKQYISPSRYIFGNNQEGILTAKS